MNLKKKSGRIEIKIPSHCTAILSVLQFANEMRLYRRRRSQRIVSRWMRRRAKRVAGSSTCIDRLFFWSWFFVHSILLFGRLHGRVSMPNIICSGTRVSDSITTGSDNVSRGREHDSKLRTERARSVRFTLFPAYMMVGRVFHLTMRSWSRRPVNELDAVVTAGKPEK